MKDILVCEECLAVFEINEINTDRGTGKWGHPCKAKKFRRETRCESYLEHYAPVRVKPPATAEEGSV